MEVFEIIDNVKSGKQEALTVLKALKDFKKEFDIQLKEIELIALEEAKNYDKNFELDGFKFEKRNGRATYDYKGIQEWSEIKESLKATEDKYKGAYLQYQKGITPIDSKTGEVIELPKVSYSKDVLIVKQDHV